jgi:hypothetical protein
MLQWNCSKHDEYNSEYLEKRLKDVDICLLQRCPKNFLSIVRNKFKNVFHTNHSKEKSLVIATNFEPFVQNTYYLTSVNLTEQSNDPNQSSHALSTTFNDIQLINFLPVYDRKYENVEITKQHTYNDLKYLFENIVNNKNCIVVGDVHNSLNHFVEIESLVSQNNFINNANDLVTFAMKTDNQIHAINLDRVLTRGNISVSNFESYSRPQDGNGHWAFTYNMEIK